jgi:hypothetical protein
MRWKPKDHKQWHRWLAWYPVMIDGEYVWLELVQRRLIGCYPCGMDYSCDWEYRCASST